jgi:hypothetical protein
VRDDDSGVVEQPAKHFFRELSGRLRLTGMLARTPAARVCDAATVLWIVVFHRVLAAKFLRAPFGFDERYFLHEGWSLTKGLVPYRDFQDFKPPVIFFVNALGLKLFGLDQMAYRHIFSILSLAGFLAVAIALLSRETNRLFVAALLALMIDHFFDRTFHDSSINSAETLSLDFFMIGCGILLIRTRWERVQQVVGGACLALSPLSKEPLVFASILAWLTILLLHRVESPRPDAAKRFARFTIAGALAVAMTWLVYMLVTHSLRWYIVELKLSIVYTRNYARQLNWFPKAPEGGVAAEYLKRLRTSYFNAAHVGVFIPLFVAPLVLWERRNRPAAIAALVTCAAALYGVTIGSGFAPHYFIMAMPGTFFWAVIGAIALDVYSKGAGVAMSRWIGATWVAIAFMSTQPRFSEEWKKYPDYKPQPPPISSGEVDFVRAHSKPGDRIWNLGDPLLYVYSDRTAARREGIVIDELIQYYPGDTDEQRLAGQREELLANRPKLVVFGQDLVNYQRKQRFMHALVEPFLRDAGYVKLNDRAYARP